MYTEQVCGVPNSDLDDRIVGGAIAAANRFPWMAAVVEKEKLLCGGVLISDRYVLTAGHCLNRLTRPDVALGIHDLHNLKEAGVIRPSIDAKKHPDFLYEPLRDINDIALIKLGQPVNFTANIRPICLPIKDRNYTKLKAEVAGWGKTEQRAKESRYLKEATLEVMSLKECANTRVGPYIKKSMICAYTVDTDACQGDSGGPLLLKRRQNKYETIGVVSWGLGCAVKGSPGVYAKVADYLDWILSSTQDSIYCKNE